MQRRRPRRLEVGAAGVLALGLVVAVLTNFATDQLPSWLSNGWVRWPLFVGVALIFVGVDNWQRRRERRAADRSPDEPPALVAERETIHPDGTIDKSKLTIQENETAIEYIRSNDRQDEDD